MPGGKPTSRKLKELLETGILCAAPAQPSPAAASDKPFIAEFRGADCLNKPGSAKETRHIVLAAAHGSADYAVGDSLGVVARNSAELVAAIIVLLRAKPETPVLSPDGVEHPLAVGRR